MSKQRSARAAAPAGPTVRTFVAINLEPEVLRALGEAQARLRRLDGGRGCRWTGVESIHLTLHFLGDVPEARLAEVFEAATRGCRGFGPFEIAIVGLGCFPNARQPRIVWAGVREETGRLADLQRAIGRELAGVGYPPERRPFTPHLTIGRARRDARRDDLAALGRTVVAQPQEVMAQMRVTRVHVISSDLQPSGAVYTILASSALGPEG